MFLIFQTNDNTFFPNNFGYVLSGLLQICVIFESTSDCACAFPPIYIFRPLRLLFSNYCVEVNHGPKLERLTELSKYSMCVIYFKLYIPYMCSLSIILNDFRKGCCVIRFSLHAWSTIFEFKLALLISFVLTILSPPESDYMKSKKL